jgi:CxxC motif-containing protein (DUF1111 family)
METIRNWVPLTGFTLFLGLGSWGLLAAMHIEHSHRIETQNTGIFREPAPSPTQVGERVVAAPVPLRPNQREQDNVDNQTTNETDDLDSTVQAHNTPSPTVAVGDKNQQSDLPNVAQGKMLFEHRWERNDRLASGGDGLGPEFNGRSCVECHFQAGPGGSGTNAHNVQAFDVLPNVEGGEVHSGVIHASATNKDLIESKAHAMFTLRSELIPFRNRDRSGSVMKFESMRTVFVNTPALWGNGLIDQISDQDLRSLNSDWRNRGRFRELADGSIGKFGWKSQIASLHDFVTTACAGELGLSNSVHSQHAPKTYEADSNAKLDLNDDQVQSLVKFVASLPAPRQIIPTEPQLAADVVAGHQEFGSIGCSRCHVQDVGLAQNVFSDFKLHFIAASGVTSNSYYPENYEPLYTPSSSFAALGEWKTPPLWAVADTAPYWHDGSAPTLRAAIKKHEKEGQSAAEEFERLGTDRQNQLLAFLGTLRAPDPLR